MEQSDMIDSFTGKCSFLSNFFASPIEWDGRTWPTVEHLFQAEKAMLDEEKELIFEAPSPTKAKKIGRTVHRQPDWAEIKEFVMHDIVLQKFVQNPELGRLLLATGDAEIIEGNSWHDNEWGDCRCEKCGDIHGQNMLGRILMNVRRELQRQYSG